MNPEPKPLWSKKTLLFLILIILILPGLVLPGIGSDKNTAGTPGDTPETRIILFHINDMHANIDNFAKIAWYVEQEKKNNPQAHVFFLNAGDNFSGNPVADQYQPKGEPIFQLLNRMGFSALELGNHEFDYGQDRLKAFIDGAKFPILCANIDLRRKGPQFPKPQPYTVLETPDGIKIAVLGLVQVENSTGIPDTHPSRLDGFCFSDPLETAKKYRFLKKENDIFIALTHLGIEDDERLIKEISELDAIVGGHSHSQVDHPGEPDGLFIAQAGSKAKYLGRLELIVKNRQIVKKSGQLIEVAPIQKEIPELRQMIDDFNKNPVLYQEIAVLPRPLNHALEVGNLVCDAMRNHFNLDIVIQNSGGIRVNHLDSTIILKDIYAIHPFENRMVQFKMTPAEIRSLIVSGYERHQRLEFLVSGLQYVIKVTPGNKVKAVELNDENGRLLEESKTYSVGLNDYVSSVYPFNHQDPGQSTTETVNEALIQYLKQEKNIPLCQGNQCLRMRVIHAEEEPVNKDDSKENKNPYR